MQIDIFLVLLPLVINGNVICTHTTLYTMILRFYLPPATKTVQSSDIQRVEGVAEGAEVAEETGKVLKKRCFPKFI